MIPGITSSLRAAAAGILALLGVACATSTLDTSRVGSTATPRQAVERVAQLQGQTVHWGGRIVSIVNREASTLVEVLSHPLARDGFPNTSRKSTGRFVFSRQGFLEPQDYAAGRLVTIVGPVTGLAETIVEDAKFVVPMVSAEQIELWDAAYHYDRQPRFGFGLGISVGF